MTWTTLRGALYALAFAAGSFLAAMGYAQFDPKTGMIDLEPFNLYLAATALVALMGAPLTALIAVIKGWGKR